MEKCGNISLFGTKCCKCRTMKQQVRCLLNEIKDIKKYEVLGICVYCKLANPFGKCERCEKLVKTSSKAVHDQNKQERFKAWLCKVNKLLRNILECELVCRHELLKKAHPLNELEKLLQELKSPLSIRQPDISFFPSRDPEQLLSLKSLAQSKEMVEELLDKLKSSVKKLSSYDSLFVSHDIQQTTSNLSEKNMKDVSKGLAAVKYNKEYYPSVPQSVPRKETDASEIYKTKKKISSVLTFKSAQEYENNDADKSRKKFGDGFKTDRSNLKFAINQGNVSKKQSVTSDNNTIIMLKPRKDIQSSIFDKENGDRIADSVIPKGMSRTKKTSDNKHKSDKEMKESEIEFTRSKLKNSKKSLSKSDLSKTKQRSVTKLSSESKIHMKKKTTSEADKEKNLDMILTSESSKIGTPIPTEEKKSLNVKKLSDTKSSSIISPTKTSLGFAKNVTEKVTMKVPKSKKTSSDILIQKLLDEAKKEKQATLKEQNSVIKDEKKNNTEQIGSLPQLKIHVARPSAEESLESIVDYKNRVSGRSKMIKGTVVVQLNTKKDDPSPDISPQSAVTLNKAKVSPITQNKAKVSPHTQNKAKVSPVTQNEENVLLSPSQAVQVDEARASIMSKKQFPGAGVINYMLSNREFIDKGWTILPTTKIMKRINIYKMQPASHQFDWFELHKNKKIMFYNSGEKLAEINEDGGGKWFYKNGTVALDFYNSEELNGGQRSIVYSNGEDIVYGHKAPRTVLATFDFLGNCVVYDKYGNERLKYNQSEGILYDEKVGSPCRWQWHSLNDPPVLRPVFVENHLKHNDPALEKLDLDDFDQNKLREPNTDMLTIEFKNFIKEKANKILQKFTPFQIRMKAFKINDYFSLRVLDQANVYLLFRHGNISLKHNLGMVLRNTEIINTEMTELDDVVTPYNKVPAKSQSIAQIQKIVKKARKIAEVRAEKKASCYLPTLLKRNSGSK